MQTASSLKIPSFETLRELAHQLHLQIRNPEIAIPIRTTLLATLPRFRRGSFMVSAFEIQIFRIEFLTRFC